MTADEVRERIRTDPDFVYLRQFDNSLTKVLIKHPDGVPDGLIARALMMTEEEVEAVYQQVVRKLRRAMGVRR